MPRPTRIIRDVCGNTVSSNEILNFAFIGDTSECTACAYKFYKQSKKYFKNCNNNSNIYK